MTDLAVIMSVYHKDRLPFLRESVRSILEQTWQDFHYYLVLDGPVSPEVDNFIRSLTDTRIRLFRLESNSGLARAMNRLLEEVMADTGYLFIARMDADDVSDKERFGKQREFLLGNPDVTVVGSWYEEIDDRGEHICYRKLPVGHEEISKRYLTRMPLAHPAVMFRRSLIEIAGNYPDDTMLMEDNVLWGRALKCRFRFANIPEYLLKFRIDKDFYRRRSGFEYGWNYIKTKTAVIRSMGRPFYISLLVVCIGIIKMFPSFLVRQVYKVKR